MSVIAVLLKYAENQKCTDTHAGIILCNVLWHAIDESILEIHNTYSAEQCVV